MAKLNKHQLSRVIIYTLSLAAVSVIIHEAAHILAALIKGVPFSSLKLGFWGINPSITLPPWIDESAKIVIFYAGGLTTGVLLLIGYLYWVQAFHKNPSLGCWIMGLTTILLASEQLAMGYLEGRYHAAYIASATSLLSPADMWTICWMIVALLLHFALCPWSKMKTVM